MTDFSLNRTDSVENTSADKDIFLQFLLSFHDMRA